MPRIVDTVHHARPYDRPVSPTTETNPILNTKSPNTTPKKEKAKRDVSTFRKWTSEELFQLFEHLSRHGTAMGKNGWENAVEGRTANQSYQTWLQSLSPFIKNSIAGKDGSTRK
ncbi:hypothetical protein L486_02178 [Kwoniella mangroviensis CBS 10435]|uniref:Myb-like domain-containing protein n=1 Tax=Kwoniella mangroviensis CBS 10435 TaxID=1331196 RepID=A0A1B9IVG2_9TREE|nr:hypothetical protein L486_02178 [Kwoniella mangroviensis CBS 10435]